MSLSFLTNDILLQGGQPTKKAAIAHLKEHEVAPGVNPSANYLAALYGTEFEQAFHARVGVNHSSVGADHLCETFINPMMVVATQRYVDTQKVIRLIRMSARQRDLLSAGWATPLDAIIVLNGPHGMVALNGHHRIMAYYYLQQRRCPARVVCAEHPLYRDLFDLYLDFNFVDSTTKAVYNGFRGNSHEFT